MTDPTPREVETACFCAGSPHPRDRFVLPAELPFEAGVAAISAITDAQAGGADMGAALIGAILRNKGISEWNLVDEEGKDLPLNARNVGARLTWQKGGVELANAAYVQWIRGQDLAPFGLASSQTPTDDSSPNGQTEPSTLPTTRTSRKRRARSG